MLLNTLLSIAYLIYARIAFKKINVHAFSFAFSLMLFFSLSASLITSYIASENYIVPGWRLLPADSWQLFYIPSSLISYHIHGILSLIIFFIFEKIIRKKNDFQKNKFKNEIHQFLKNNDTLYLTLIFFVIFSLSSIIFYFKLGITGIETSTTLRVSGIIYYIRLIGCPFFVAYLCYNFSPKYSNIIIIFIIIYVISLSQASRLIPSTCVVSCLIIWRHSLFLSKSLFIILLGFLVIGLVTLSRGILYDDNNAGYNLLNYFILPFVFDFGFGVLQYGFFIDMFDIVFLRLGGFHEAYYVEEMLNSGYNCASFLNFLEIGRVCENVANDVFHLNLGSMQFGMNLSSASQQLLLIQSDSFLNNFLYFLYFLLFSCASIFVYKSNKIGALFLTGFCAFNLYLGHTLIILILLLFGIFIRIFFYKLIPLI